MGKERIEGAEAVRGVLQKACLERELLILVTPYLRYESTFLRLDAEVVHIAATMSGEEALYGLRHADLHIRFPSGSQFMEASTQLMGFGVADARRSLRLAIPTVLRDDELRTSYRVERPGRVEVTFSTPKYQILMGLLVNVSTSGVKIHAPRLELEAMLSLGGRIALTVPLTPEIRIETQALVRWVSGRTAGLEFQPPLPEKLLAKLVRWVFQHREEEREQALRKGIPTQAFTSIQTPVTQGDLVLVSSSPELEAVMRQAFTDLPRLQRIPPTLQALKECVTRMPSLIFFHAPSTGLDDRRRLRAMSEFLAGRWPLVLVGQDLESGPLLELGTEIKALSTFMVKPTSGAFFNRLVQGILRRHGAEGEAAVDRD